MTCLLASCTLYFLNFQYKWTPGEHRTNFLTRSTKVQDAIKEWHRHGYLNAFDFSLNKVLLFNTKIWIYKYFKPTLTVAHFFIKASPQKWSWLSGNCIMGILKYINSFPCLRLARSVVVGNITITILKIIFFKNMILRIVIVYLQFKCYCLKGLPHKLCCYYQTKNSFVRWADSVGRATFYSTSTLSLAVVACTHTSPSGKWLVE